MHSFMSSKRSKVISVAAAGTLAVAIAAGAAAATLPSGTVTVPLLTGRTRLCGGTIVSAASLSWIESEKTTPTRAKTADAKNAR